MIWKIDFTLTDPWIHPEDLMKAMHARIDEARKRRGKGVSEEVIVGDLFIASLVNNRPWNQHQVEKLMELSTEKNFCERLARAFANGKPATWDPIDRLILQNWRELHLQLQIKAPGLQDWSPKAAAALVSD